MLSAKAFTIGLRYLAINSSSFFVGVTAAITEARVTTAVTTLMMVKTMSIYGAQGMPVLRTGAAISATDAFTESSTSFLSTALVDQTQSNTLLSVTSS